MCDGSLPLTHVYMIGDNPESDMQGCVNMNGASASGEYPTATLDGTHHTSAEEWIAASRDPGTAENGPEGGGALSVADWIASEQSSGEASSQGPRWSGVLVRTGVYSGSGPTNQAAVVVDDVSSAVTWILDQGAGAGEST